MKLYNMKTCFIAIIVIVVITCCDSKKYHNYSLFRGIPVNDSHLEFLKSLGARFDVNYWRPPGMMFMPVEFMVGPSEQPVFLREANKYGLYLTTIIEDVQKAFDMQTVKRYIRRKMDSFDWNNYFRLNDIYQWLRDLKKAYPNEMELYSIGKTYENRDIMAVSILLRGSISRSKVIIEGGIHAREWISPAFVTYMIHQILHANQSSDKALRDISHTYEWHFVPILNPDGYEFSHTQDRLWRKNRHNGDYGVDLNRNFDIGFGSVGVSFKRDDEIHCGRKAFSEKETLAVSKWITSKSSDLEYYIAFHSYGQYMIVPYAHSRQHHENFDQVSIMCKKAAQRIAERYNTEYTIGTAYDTVGYLTSGVSSCWVKKSFNVPYVITFELRDNGHHGFALPPSNILPTCRETMDGILSLLTPQPEKFHGKILSPNTTALSREKCNILDKFVMICNALLFITVQY